MNIPTAEEPKPFPLRLVCIAGAAGSPSDPLPPSPPAWVSYAIIIVASVLIVAMTMVFL
jgi:hypothetical protein